MNTLTQSNDVHILIVEDDRDTRDLYCHALEFINVRSSTAGTAQEALTALKLNDLPTAVILDLNVPGMPSDEFHASLKSLIDPTQTKLIVISGADSISARARELNAWKYLRKPFELSDLLASVKELQ